MVERFSTGGRGPLGVSTNSPINDSGTSARILNRPHVPLAAASLPWDHDGRPRARIGLNRTMGTVQFPQLQMGTRGQNVQRLQRLLNSRLDSDTDLKVDGSFGPKTRSAVIEFQKESHLKPDGVVGRDTWFSLISASPKETRSRPKPASALASAATRTATTAGVIATSTEKSVDEWSIEERFEYVLTHTGPYLGPDLRTQFAALLTPVNLGIMIGSLVVWAAGHFFGVSEIADAFLLGFGLVFLGKAALDAAGYLKDFIELTCSASTKAELENAASDLAQAITIIGVVAFFMLLAKVSRAIGDKLETAKKTAAPGEEETAPPPKAKPEAKAPKRAAEQEPSKKTALTKDPIAAELEGSEFNGVKADRVRPGTNGKVAVVGRSMSGAAEPYAQGLKAGGYDVETFSGDKISSSAQAEWEHLKDYYSPDRIPDNVVPSTQMFFENQAWAQKLADQGYTVVDVDNPGGQSASPFYEMEKATLFGD